MQKDRLNIYVNPTLAATIRELAGNEEQRISKLAEELLELGLSLKRGEVIEAQSLPIIRNIVQTELRKHFAQQRMDMREDLHLEFTQEFQAVQRASDNRLAALLVRIGRDAHVAYRLVFSLLALAHGRAKALEIYEDAREKAGAALSRKGDDA